MNRTPNEHMTTEAAIAMFDSLEPATPDLMIGDWRGEGVDTDHPMDGMLEASSWHGKRFVSENEVHPLIHKGLRGKTFSINPAFLPLKLTMNFPLRDTLIPVLFPVYSLFIRTKSGKARLRQIEFRERLHAAMCYDAKPINDVFAKYDDDTLMGWMDFKGMEQPYFFKLFRE